MIIPIGSFVRLLRWIFTNPRGALRFFLMAALIVIAMWSFFAVALTYASPSGANAGISLHILFYVVAILDLTILIALPFLLQLYDRLAHLPPDDPSIGCLFVLGILSIPVLVVWVLIGFHSKTLPEIEGTIMGTLLFIAFGICVYLSIYLMRKRQKEQSIERAAAAIRNMGPRSMGR